jgi:hypothetical protein
MRRADAALYEAKRRGRDRVRSADMRQDPPKQGTFSPLLPARTGS